MSNQFKMICQHFERKGLYLEAIDDGCFVGFILIDYEKSKWITFSTLSDVVRYFEVNL